ncbi:MAG: hypothetical protein A2Y62_04880 [Candidatus Fischerbacteria bacterium RBG_13_37_8]|uniref:Metal ABC transporter permease n=1 Tax=Candidatus Fischerbacteria bacterium RBG_13_37_8 TaxID=1817863 RepID=A0A1F5VHN5_9BACT|nr:MAG: hypothetical protein A2Y62_04880 [Candidatus Fischerbacteria bacterium RBG_13_37_8]
MFEALHYEFMQNALIAALLASIACGIIGTYVVVKRMGYIAGGIAHTSFGGIGLGYFLNINPLLCLIPFTLASSLGIGIITKKTRVSEDTAIGIFWAMGMALGVVFIGLTPGYAPDLFSYLFGNILTVSRNDIYYMLVLDGLIIATVLFLYKELLAISFDEEYAQVSGVKTTLLYLILLSLIALTVVILVRIVGIILVIALLTIPAAIAKLFTRSLSRMMLVAGMLGCILTIAGLWLSYKFNIASGAMIILLSGCVFIVTTFFVKK